MYLCVDFYSISVYHATRHIESSRNDQLLSPGASSLYWVSAGFMSSPSLYSSSAPRSKGEKKPARGWLKSHPLVKLGDSLFMFFGFLWAVGLPSGKLTVCNGKSTHAINGKIAMLNYQRVPHHRALSSLYPSVSPFLHLKSGTQTSVGANRCCKENLGPEFVEFTFPLVKQPWDKTIPCTSFGGLHWVVHM